MSTELEISTPPCISAPLPVLLEPAELSASSDDDDSGNYNPEAEVERSLASSQNRTPQARRVQGSSINTARKMSARQTDPNEGRCLLAD